MIVRDFEVSTTQPDARPPIVLDDVDGFFGDHVAAAREAASPFFRLAHERRFEVRGTPGVADTSRAEVKREEIPAKK